MDQLTEIYEQHAEKVGKKLLYIWDWSCVQLKFEFIMLLKMEFYIRQIMRSGMNIRGRKGY